MDRLEPKQDDKYVGKMPSRTIMRVRYLRDRPGELFHVCWRSSVDHVAHYGLTISIDDDDDDDEKLLSTKICFV